MRTLIGTETEYRPTVDGYTPSSISGCPLPAAARLRFARRLPALLIILSVLTLPQGFLTCLGSNSSPHRQKVVSTGAQTGKEAESRCQDSSPKQPTTELQLLQEINRARTEPRKYKKLLEAIKKERDSFLFPRSEGLGVLEEAIRFLDQATQLPPLTWSDALHQAAQDHAQDSGRLGFFGHTGTDESDFSDRISRYGKWEGSIAENISYGLNQPQDIVIAWIIDDGVSSRGHRKTLFSNQFQLAGLACAAHSKMQVVCVADFAEDVQ